jgi:hypothetical protein
MATRTRTIYKTTDGQVIHGIMAEYATPADLYHAAEKVRDAGYSRWDVYSPFPVHGMDDAMGTPPTKLPLLVAVVGLSGASLGFLLQYWVGHIAYRTIVQGKPTNAWEPFVPVTFELGILFTAFAALLGMIAFNKLPMWYHPLMKKERFLKVSDDRFVIHIESADPKFDPSATRALLEKSGGTRVDLVEE